MPIIQQIFRKFYEKSARKFKFSFEQKKVADNIMNCRTGAFGKRYFECDHCQDVIERYISCNDRHCPICQNLKKEKWIDARRKDLVNAPYFHVVFTVPQELRMVIYCNKKILYNLMFKAVSRTLGKLSADSKYVGAQVGHISILHTWTQALDYHPHIHAIVLGGGLNAANQWQQSKDKFFIPVKVLAKVFRGIFLQEFKKCYQANTLAFYGNSEQYKQPGAFKKLIDTCYKKDWYVYAKKTFKGPEQVIKYLGRYTHRIAIANERIKSFDAETVTFLNKKKMPVILRGEEFVRRFLMHVIPRGFVKVRHQGILSNRNRKTKLALCKTLTNTVDYKPRFEKASPVDILKILTGKDISICKTCGVGKMLMTHIEFKNTA